MKAITFEDELGANPIVGEIPSELVEQAQEYHHQLSTRSRSTTTNDERVPRDETSVTADMLSVRSARRR